MFCKNCGQFNIPFISKCSKCGQDIRRGINITKIAMFCLLIVPSISIVLIIGDKILMRTGERYIHPVHFIFEMPEKLPEEIADRFGVPLHVTAEKVYLVCSFNNWGQGKDAFPGYEMKKAGARKWEFDFGLPSGRYEYKFRFVPNNIKVTKNQAPGETGFIWIHDLNARRNVDDGFGGYNSVLQTGVPIYKFRKVINILKWILASFSVIFFLIWLAVNILSDIYSPVVFKIFNILGNALFYATLLILFILLMFGLFKNPFEDSRYQNPKNLSLMGIIYQTLKSK